MCHSMAAATASIYYCEETAVVGLESVSCDALLQLFLFSLLQCRTRAQCQLIEDLTQKDLVRDQTGAEGHDGLHHPRNMGKFLFQNRPQRLLVGILE